MENLALFVLIGGAGLAVIMLVVGVVITVRTGRSDVEDRLEEIVREEEPEYQDDDEQRERRNILTEWLNTRVTGSSWADNVSKNLAMADIKMKPGEYAALMIVASAGLALFGFLLGSSSIILGIIGAVLGFFAPGFYVNRTQKNRLKKFNDQLGDMLNLLVNGLRAGYSTAQAMEAVSKEMPTPMSDEFRRVVQEMALGVPMEQALENLLRRIPSDDLDLTITAINVQREVGGNLAEILDTISFTIRERVRIKGEIETLTTSTRYSGRILSMMPVLVLAILYIANRPYMMAFFMPENNFDPNSIGGSILPCGYCARSASAILIVSGYFAMKKLSEVDI